MTLKGKVVCISGASSGIGWAVAEECARAGAKLILGARRQERLKELAGNCEKLGAEGILVEHLDVCNDASVDQFLKTSLAWTKNGVDVLVNNAGLALGTEPLAQGNPNDWQHVIDVNVMGVLRLTRAFLPHFVQIKNGHIVMLSSIAAHQVYEGGAVYCASKAAVKALSAALKLELNGTKVRLTTIDPGMVETEFSEVRFRGDKDRAKKVYAGLTPLSAKDIAETVVFALTRPAHVNIDQMIIMPTDQASVYKVHRT